VNKYKVRMKHTVMSLMNSAGLFAPFRLASRGKALILMYHRFSETGEGISTPARRFAEQLDYLTQHYRIAPLSEVAGYLQSGKPMPSGLAVVTIDDGYRDAYEIAFPILRERKVPATLFVVTDFVDRKCWLWTDKLRYLTARAESRVFEAAVNGRALRIELSGRAARLQAAEQINGQLKRMTDDAKDEAIERLASVFGVGLPALPPPELSSLTPDELREMDAAGVEIGSHTVTHQILTKVSGERLRYELRESRSRLESILGRKVTLLGYPNGNHNRSVQKEAARAGYRCAVTADYGLNNGRSNPLALKRIHTERDMAQFVKNTSGFDEFRRLLGRLGPEKGNAEPQPID
jgi:peptidoglycan/xylan/chitin deacetylase (PgdA/CDA1 family)